MRRKKIIQRMTISLKLTLSSKVSCLINFEFLENNFPDVVILKGGMRVVVVVELSRSTQQMH